MWWVLGEQGRAWGRAARAAVWVGRVGKWMASACLCIGSVVAYVVCHKSANKGKDKPSHVGRVGEGWGGGASLGRVEGGWRGWRGAKASKGA